MFTKSSEHKRIEHLTAVSQECVLLCLRECINRTDGEPRYTDAVFVLENAMEILLRGLEDSVERSRFQEAKSALICACQKLYAKWIQK
jgi:hypothetical protein